MTKIASVLMILLSMSACAERPALTQAEADYATAEQSHGPTKQLSSNFQGVPEGSDAAGCSSDGMLCIYLCGDGGACTSRTFGDGSVLLTCGC